MANVRLYIVLLLIVCTACTHRFDGVEDNTPIGNMECLWRTLDDKYCYFEEKSIDWQKVHDEYVPKVKSVRSGDYLALFDTLANMVNSLHDGHVNIYSNFDISRCDSWYAGYPKNWDWEVVKNYYLTDYRIAGGAYYNTIADGQVGYIYVGSFEQVVSANNMAYILRSFKDCKGVIVDVRDNGGGDLENAYQLAATFFRQDTTVGYWQHKNGRGHNDFSSLEPQQLRKSKMPSTWLRPVVVLCNRKTYSAANFFVSIMRYAYNSAIMGGVSGGGGGMPLSYELPNGWTVRFSSIRMFDASKNSIEPGISPDVFVEDDPQTNQDEIIDAAVQVIKKCYKNDTSH